MAEERKAQAQETLHDAERGEQACENFTADSMGVMADERKALIRKKSLEILHNAGCDEETYESVTADIIEKDLRMAFPYGIKGFTYEEIAEDIFSLSNTERGWKEPVEYAPDGDAAHYGISELYPWVREKLEELIGSGEPFKTGGLNSKKEICGFTLYRRLTNGPIIVSVWAGMDEDLDLVSDAIPYGAPPDILSYEEMNEIMDAVDEQWLEMGYNSDMTCDGTVPGNATLDEVLKKAESLYGKAMEILDSAFNCVVECIKERIIAKGGEKYYEKEKKD